MLTQFDTRCKGKNCVIRSHCERFIQSAIGVTAKTPFYSRMPGTPLICPLFKREQPAAESVPNMYPGIDYAVIV